MHYTEEEIWKLTPRQFNAQLKVHEHMMRMMYGSPGKNPVEQPIGFIDQIKGW